MRVLARSEGVESQKMRRKMLALFVGFERVGDYEAALESPGQILNVEDMAKLAGFKEAPSVVSGRAVGDLAGEEDFDCWRRLRAAVPSSLRDMVYVYDGPKARVYGLDIGGEDFKLVGLIRKEEGKLPPCQ